jgi:hypothetical protein
VPTSRPLSGFATRPALLCSRIVTSPDLAHEQVDLGPWAQV